METDPAKTNSETRKQAKQGAKAYARYSALFFQMLVAVGLLAWGGNWLDGYWDLPFPILTITGMFLGLGASFYQLFKELKKNDSE